MLLRHGGRLDESRRIGDEDGWSCRSRRSAWRRCGCRCCQATWRWKPVPVRSGHGSGGGHSGVLGVDRRVGLGRAVSSADQSRMWWSGVLLRRTAETVPKRSWPPSWCRRNSSLELVAGTRVADPCRAGGRRMSWSCRRWSRSWLSRRPVVEAVCQDGERRGAWRRQRSRVAIYRVSGQGVHQFILSVVRLLGPLHSRRSPPCLWFLWAAIGLPVTFLWHFCSRRRRVGGCLRWRAARLFRDNRSRMPPAAQSLSPSVARPLAVWLASRTTRLREVVVPPPATLDISVRHPGRRSKCGCYWGGVQCLDGTGPPARTPPNTVETDAATRGWRSPSVTWRGPLRSTPDRCAEWDPCRPPLFCRSPILLSRLSARPARNDAQPGIRDALAAVKTLRRPGNRSSLSSMRPTRRRQVTPTSVPGCSTRRSGENTTPGHELSDGARGGRDAYIAQADDLE